MTNEELYNILKTKTDDMRKSRMITNHMKHFFDTNNNLETFAGWMKKIASCPLKPGVARSFPDPTYSRTNVNDETYAFYYTLDQMTGGKHDLLKKVTEQEQYITYSATDRSSCGTNPAVDSNGQETIIKKIIICEEPLINNRTAKMHECWHAIDEKNYNLSTKSYPNQFFGEIGTMAIDFMASEFLKTLHPTDKQFCDHISYLQNEAKFNDNIEKARDGYLDYLFAKIMVGTTKEQSDALQEVVANMGKLWDLNVLECKLRQIDAWVHNPQNKHYDPMYECRYVPASAIVFELRKSKLSSGEKVDKIAQLNEHLLSLDALNTAGATSDWQIITNHFSIPEMEKVIDNLATTITQANSSIQHSIKV